MINFEELSKVLLPNGMLKLLNKIKTIPSCIQNLVDYTILSRNTAHL